MSSLQSKTRDWPVGTESFTVPSYVKSGTFRLIGGGGGGGGGAVSVGWWGTKYCSSGGGGGGGGTIDVEYVRDRDPLTYSITVGGGGSGGSGEYVNQGAAGGGDDNKGKQGDPTYMVTVLSGQPWRWATAYGGNGGNGGMADHNGSNFGGDGGSGGGTSKLPPAYAGGHSGASGSKGSNTTSGSPSGGAGAGGWYGYGGGGNGGPGNTSGDGYLRNGASGGAGHAFFYYDYYVWDVTVVSGNPGKGTASVLNGSAWSSSTTVYDRDSVKVSATAVDSQYRFAYWKIGNDVVSYNANDTITITADTTLTAVFERYVFDIHYTLNGGNRNNSDTTYDKDHAKSLAKPTRQYCTLAGEWWYVTSGPSNILHTYITTIPTGTTGDIYLEARWVGNSATVNYVYGTLPDGGTIINNPPGPNTVTYVLNPNDYSVSNAQKVTLPNPDTTNSIYGFYGWYTSPQFTDSGYEGGSSQDFGYSGNVTLYARWYYVALTVTPSLGSGATGNYLEYAANVKPGVTQEVYIWSEGDESQPTRDTYDFQGWSTDDHGATGILDPGDILEVTCSRDNVGIPDANGRSTRLVTVYAIWDPVYYVTIEYHPNGGHWGTDTEDVTPRVYTDRSTIPNRSVNVFGLGNESYVDPQHEDVGDDPETEEDEGVSVVFKGWSPDSNTNVPLFDVNESHNVYVGQGTDYTYPADGSRTIYLVLYAVWPDRHIIVFDGNGYYVSDLYQGFTTVDEYVGYYVADGTSMILVTDDNKSSLGITPGTTIAYGLNDVLIIASDVLKGTNTFTVNTLPNGYLAPEYQSNHESHTFGLRDRHVFVDWYDARSGGNVVDITHEFTSDIDLYAQWAVIYYITFVPPVNTTISETSMQTNRYSKLDSLPTIERGDVFIKRWYAVLPNGTKPTVDLNYVFTADTVVECEYIPSYTITFDLNAPNARCDVTTMKTNGTYQLEYLPTATREGYTFKGWCYSNTPGIPVSAGTVFQGNRTLLAIWEARTYDITFDPNGGTLPQADSVWYDCVFGRPLNEIQNAGKRPGFPVPTATGSLEFMGWSDMLFEAGTGDPNMRPDQIFDSESYATLFAVWRTGSKVVTFDAMGGTVNPSRSVTNMDGVLSYYPIPYRTGYEFLGWYNWPVYISNSLITQTNVNQNDIWAAYTSASGISDRTKAIINTLLINQNGNSGTQFQLYDDSGTKKWKDVSDRVFDVEYVTTETIVTLDANGQSDFLSNSWRNGQRDGGWTQLTQAVTPTYTKNGEPFTSLEELYNYSINIGTESDPAYVQVTPKNNDTAQVHPEGLTNSYYFRFNIPYGLTIVLVRADENQDKAYMWIKDTTVVIDGVHVDGRWVDVTTQDSTIVLPNRVYDADATLYAHWQETPFPPSRSNTCYIERRLNKNTADTIRIYMPPVTSITDTISTNLVQKDTLMFGYENKFLSDLGNSRRFSVSFERVNPMPYDDYSSDPAKWSNSKWYDMLVSFTNYWQNSGRDPATGSLVGGFRFHYIPVVSSEDDDRVDYSDLYPVIDKNVFLVGAMEVDFTPMKMTFTMNFAVGAMTSDGNSSGYPIQLISLDPTDPSGRTSALFTSYTPDGLDYNVPERPTEWVVPEGFVFTGWEDSNGTTYRSGNVIPYSTIAKYRKDNNQDLKLYAKWVQSSGCIMLTRDYFDTLGVKVPSLVDIVHDSRTGSATLTFKKDVLVNITMIGAGGGGAGGDQKTITMKSGNSFIDTVSTIITTTQIMKALVIVCGGGGGGSGELVTKSVYADTGDKFICEIGVKGGTKYIHDALENWQRFHCYTDGYDGGTTKITHTFAQTNAPAEYVAKGGSGGKSNGAGGEVYFSGGSGCDVEKTQATDGSTAVTGSKGTPGKKGENYGDKNQHVGTFLLLWYGGGGGGATSLNRKFKVGNVYLTRGSDNGNYVSKGADAASKGKDALWNAQFGGGGGGGCGGYNPSTIGNLVMHEPSDVVHMMKPSSGADGVIFIELIER